MKNDEGGMESRQLPRLHLGRRSRVTKPCGTLVGTTVNKPICAMQAHLVQLDSIQPGGDSAMESLAALLGYAQWHTQLIGAIPCGMLQPPPRCRY
jgi:hypothetical protein